MTPAEQQKLAARAERETAWQRRRQERFAAQDREFLEAVRQHVLQEARREILQWIRSRAFGQDDPPTTKLQ